MRVSTVVALASLTKVTFPAKCSIVNSSWKLLVEPETRTAVEPYSTAEEVTIGDASQLRRVVDNIEQMNRRAGWNGEDAGLMLEIQDPPVTTRKKASAATGDAAGNPQE